MSAINIPPTPFRYLNHKYKHQKVAARSVYTDGGHRGDSIPVNVPVIDARFTRPTIPLEITQQLDHLGHCLVDFNSSEWQDVKTLNISAMEHDVQLQQSYYSACERCVLRATGATYARAFNFTLRDSRIKGVHTKPSGDNSARGPVNDVHTDYTPNAPGVKAITELVRKKMNLGEDVRFALFNVWRNVSTEPIQTWPLAVCNANSIHPNELIERISPENNNVIHNVLPNSKQHEWRYYSRMTNQECLIFKQYDTNTDNLSRFTPHTAFDLLAATQSNINGDVDDQIRLSVPPRESCEVRVLVIFDDSNTSKLKEVRRGTVNSKL